MTNYIVNYVDIMEFKSGIKFETHDKLEEFVKKKNTKNMINRIVEMPFTNYSNIKKMHKLPIHVLNPIKVIKICSSRKN